MDTLSDILIKPVLTEKTNMLKNTVRQVAFLVEPRANQIQVGKAVEKAFNVKVEKVNIVRRKPLRRKRQGRVIGQYAGWKKAYVMLAEGSTIELFEGV